MSIFQRIIFKNWGNAPQKPRDGVPEDEFKWVSSSNLALLALAHLLDQCSDNPALADELRRRGSAERKPQEKTK